jgi:phage terminase large subunit-like protein
MIVPQPDDLFCFDEDAADRPCRFIEKFCTHFEGAHAGSPFALHPVQRRIVRDVYGWKWRRGPQAGLRRFTDVYFEGAVGCGKSPLLAALGLYGLIADGEPGAQVYSLASTYGQARVVFDAAKRFAQTNADLARRLRVRQFEIRHPASGSFWRIVSGKGPGAGARPSTVLADEVHEWPNAGGYQALRDRMFKRRQPLLFAATNAGESRASFCWQLRERAVAALAGRGEASLYPVIWAADDEAPTTDPAAWRAANPLLGVTISEAKVAALAAAADADPAETPGFRRLYLGIWPKAGGGRWLDLSAWDACTADDEPPADAALYVGLDLSQGDDLCAAAYVWATAERYYVGADFWLPESTGALYQRKDGIPYGEWAEAGHITLLDEPTISPAVRRRIARRIIAVAATGRVRAVCYDRYRADDTVAELEAKGLTCTPVAQGYTLSPGCHELERRLKEGSVTVAANPVLRWNAENCEVKTDDRGNIWPAKPHAKGRYAGKRGAKIDGITALVTALTEARKHTFPTAAKQSKARAYSI